MHQSTIYGIKRIISAQVGKNVELVCRSRRKESIHRGVLEGAYGSLFTVKVLVDGIEQRVSYTYTDVLTRSVIVKPLPKSAEIKS